MHLRRFWRSAQTGRWRLTSAAASKRSPTPRDVDELLPKAGKKKGGGASASAGGKSSTKHLRERQAQRAIPEDELSEAVARGERQEFPDGTVHYRHRGIVYVTGKDGAGITAWRHEPPQCVCRDYGWLDAGSKRDMRGKISIGIGKGIMACRPNQHQNFRYGGCPGTVGCNVSTCSSGCTIHLMLVEATLACCSIGPWTKPPPPP